MREESRRVSRRTGLDAADLCGAGLEALWRHSPHLLEDPDSGALVCRTARLAMWREAYRAWAAGLPDEAAALAAHSSWSRSETACAAIRACDVAAEAVRYAERASDPLDRAIESMVARLLTDAGEYYAFVVGTAQECRALTSPSASSVARFMGLGSGDARRMREMVREFAAAGLSG